MSDKKVSPRPSTSEHSEKKEPQAYKKGALNTVRRQFNKLPGAARAALLAITVLTGAGAVHHATGADVPGPIPVGGIVDKVGSTAVDDIDQAGRFVVGKILGTDLDSHLKQYEGIQTQAGNVSDGAIYVRSSFVNQSVDQGGSHVVRFGNADVTQDAQGYVVRNPALNLPRNGNSSTDRDLPLTNQAEMVVPVTFADGTSGYLLVPIDNPMGARGTGNPDAVVATQATTIATIEPNGTVDQPDNNGVLPATAQELSQATSTTAPAPQP